MIVLPQVGGWTRDLIAHYRSRATLYRLAAEVLAERPPWSTLAELSSALVHVANPEPWDHLAYVLRGESEEPQPLLICVEHNAATRRELFATLGMVPTTNVRDDFVALSLVLERLSQALAARDYLLAADLEHQYSTMLDTHAPCFDHTAAMLQQSERPSYRALFNALASLRREDATRS